MQALIYVVLFLSIKHCGCRILKDLCLKGMLSSELGWLVHIQVL